MLNGDGGEGGRREGVFWWKGVEERVGEQDGILPLISHSSPEKSYFDAFLEQGRHAK